jgi:hypothetical protein
LEGYNFLDKDLVDIIGSILVQISICILLDYFYGIEVEYLFVGCNSICIVGIVGGMSMRMVDICFVDYVEINSMVEMVEN